MASQKTNPIVSVEDPEAFNRKLLEGRVTQYTSSEKIASEYIFFDRGIPDVHAYMRCFGQDFDTDFVGPVYRHRYDKIYLMPPWKEIYVPDAERFETYEESEKVYLALLRTYKDFGYEPTLVPKSTIGERTDFILEYLEDT